MGLSVEYCYVLPSLDKVDLFIYFIQIKLIESLISPV